MARPLVLVFQELAQVTVTPTVPDLNSVVLGPAYDLFDFPDDAQNILLNSTFGELEKTAGNGTVTGYVPPLTGEEAVIVNDGAYPAQNAGSLVDHGAVKLFLKTPKVVIGTTQSNIPLSVAPSFGASITTDKNDQTLLVITAAVTNDFVVTGVQPGDRVILTSSRTTVEQKCVRVVSSVGEPNTSGLVPAGNEAKLRLTQNLPPPDPAATGNITAIAAASIVDGQQFVLNDGVNPAVTFEFDNNASVVPSATLRPVTYVGGETATQMRDLIKAAINAAPTLNITASNGTTSADVALVNDIGGQEGNQTITETVANVGFVVTGMSGGSSSADTWKYDTLTEIRIERTLETQQLNDLTNTYITFPEPGTDKLVIKGGITLSLALTPAKTVATPNPVTTTVSRGLSYSELYLAYRALRQDLQDVDSVSASDILINNGVTTVGKLGKLDARNPLAVGVFTALQNSGTAPIYFFGVASNDAAGHTAARDAIESRADLYCMVPLVQDINILAAYRNEINSMADPNIAQQTGVAQIFRIVLGSIPLPVTETIFEDSISGVSQKITGLTTNKYRTLNVANASTGDVNFRNVLPGDIVTIGLTPATATWQARRGNHTVSHVNSSKDYPNSGDPSNLELLPGTSRWVDSASTPAGAIELVVKSPDGTVKLSNLAELTISVGVPSFKFKMRNPTTVGGPYRVTFSVGASITVTLSGFDITITADGVTHTRLQVLTAILANAVIASIMDVTAVAGVDGSIVVPGSQSPAAPAEIMPGLVSGNLVTADVALNDDLFDRLEDATASFLTAGVKPGDTLEIPIDPNDYSGGAFTDRRVLSYKISQVLNENRLQIQNGVDDSPTAAKELPHYFARDLQDRYVDLTLPNAMNYRIVRALSKDEQILSLAGTSQSILSKRVTIVWPDKQDVSDLRDGSLPRTVSTELELAGPQPSYYLACAIAGAVTGLPPQHGLTNLGLAAISKLYNSNGYFKEAQLTKISEAGFMVMVQRTPGELPYSIHQLTTDPSSLETGELSVVKNFDFISKFFQDILGAFLGQYNVLPETLNEIFRAVSDGGEQLKTRKVARIGPPLLSGSVTDLRVSDFAADRVVLFYAGSMPRPLNTVEFHVVA